MPVQEGVAYWASVTTPNTRFEPKYTVNLVVDEETAQAFKDRGFTVKDMDEGPALIIRRNVNGPNGMIRKAPKLFDRQKNLLDINIGNGSRVKVQFKEWEVNRSGQTFKGLDFQALQVLDLIEFSTDGSELEAELEELDEL